MLLGNIRNKETRDYEIFFQNIFIIMKDCRYISFNHQKINSEIHLKIENYENINFQQDIEAFQPYLTDSKEQKDYKRYYIRIRTFYYKELNDFINEYINKIYIKDNTLIYSYKDNSITDPFFLIIFILKTYMFIIINLLIIKLFIFNEKNYINALNITNTYFKELYKKCCLKNNIDDYNRLLKNSYNNVYNFLKKRELDIEFVFKYNLRYYSDIAIENSLFGMKERYKRTFIFKKYKANLIFCNSIASYLKEIKNIEKNNKQNKPKIIYYRGNKANYNLIPSLYRDKKLPEIEHIINNRIIQSMPKNFEGCTSFFDKLTLLKHFNCPSRLLDITSNSLIAAFFALDNYYSTTPSDIGVINCCFPHNIDNVKNSINSDSVALLSALCTTDKKKYLLNMLSQLEELSNNLKDLNNPGKKNKSKNIDQDKSESQILNKIESIVKKLLEIYKNNRYYELKKDFYKILNEIQIYEEKENENTRANTLIDINENLKKTLKSLKENDKYNRHFFFEELQHQASLINPTFNLFTPSEYDINTSYIVHPSLNNERIRNQQGLFILIGAAKDEENHYLNRSTHYLKFFDDKELKRNILIINNKNNKFYESLNIIHGINKGFLYPELENQVTQIKNNVMFEYGIE